MSKQIRYDAGDYIEKGFRSYYSFIDGTAYAAALDSLVFACVDILVICDNLVLLGKRTRDPEPNWFMFGGRMRPGETLQASAKRLIAVEMGLDISEERFDFLTCWSAAWKHRAHPPFDHGSHNVSMTMVLELSIDEEAVIWLNDEYSASKKMSLVGILEDKTLHPSLRQCVRALTQKRLGDA